MSSNWAKQFRDQLSRRVLVADGAMGTMLYARGVFINRCYDELNLSTPAMVKEIHEEYVKAGAEILETNTFGAGSAGPLGPGSWCSRRGLLLRKARRPPSSTTSPCWSKRGWCKDACSVKEHAAE